MVVVVVYSLSCVRLFVTPWTVTHQAPLSTGFPRQGYWSILNLSASSPNSFAMKKELQTQQQQLVTNAFKDNQC